jgi:hypothetical protein
MNILGSWHINVKKKGAGKIYNRDAGGVGDERISGDTKTMSGVENLSPERFITQRVAIDVFQPDARPECESAPGRGGIARVSVGDCRQRQ